MFKKTAFFAAALIGPASLFGLAATSTPAAAATTLVHYDDLDLSTQEGQDKLEARLVRAAKKVCGRYETTTGTHMSQANRCMREATRKVSDQIAAAVEDQANYTRFGG